jgi:hypothetical protein
MYLVFGWYEKHRYERSKATTRRGEPCLLGPKNGAKREKARQHCKVTGSYIQTEEEIKRETERDKRNREKQIDR